MNILAKNIKDFGWLKFIVAEEVGNAFTVEDKTLFSIPIMSDNTLSKDDDEFGEVIDMTEIPKETLKNLQDFFGEFKINL